MHALTLANVRIAMVSDFYLDYVGGAQTSMLEQRTALEAAGHEVLMIRAVRRGQAARGPRVHDKGDGLELRPVFTVPGVVLPVNSARPKLITRLREYFVAERVDVVHLQTEFGIAHAATTAAKAIGVPVVSTIHTFYWQSSGWWQPLTLPIISPRAAQHHRRTLPEGAAHRPADRQPAAQSHARPRPPGGCRRLAVRPPGRRPSRLPGSGCRSRWCRIRSLARRGHRPC